ncbi:hypothetical protein V6N13_011792 [Hibiscus sabdariffa]|uniref:Uncharacterized protein n=1 Tax=Hibiscus sabdariffa TaxID=183260 RepID=A0ABR2SDW3_9ROSI
MLETLLPGCFVWKYQNETTTFANVGLRPVQEINYVRHVCVEQIFLRPLVHASFPELRDFGGFDGLLKTVRSNFTLFKKIGCRLSAYFFEVDKCGSKWNPENRMRLRATRFTRSPD